MDEKHGKASKLRRLLPVKQTWKEKVYLPFTAVVIVVIVFVVVIGTIVAVLVSKVVYC